MSELTALLARHCHQDVTPTAFPRLTLSRAPLAAGLTCAVYYPLFCVVARGSKRVFLGREEFRYDPNTYLISSVDLPVTGEVLEAPCLGLVLALDPAVLAGVLLSLPAAPPEQKVYKAMAVNPLGDDLRDPLVRLLRLLDQPADIPVLAPLIEREILYRLLLGPRGGMLRQLALPSRELSQVQRAIHLIRQRYDQPIRVDELARAAGMSAPSLHRHFRAVTAMSPLQFQKKIRLQEARRRLLTQETDATRVSFDVGYESPSQFSREYRRLFGAPPTRDTRRLRQQLAAG